MKKRGSFKTNKFVLAIASLLYCLTFKAQECLSTKPLKAQSVECKQSRGKKLANARSELSLND